MSLNASNFVNQGPIRSADMKQFVDLFTGVMIDQPVTFRNTLTVGGSQGSSTPPLKLFGVAGQTGNLIELYPTTGSANPTFGFGALGNFAWGPGSPAANDTFLSRVALQNGHVTDTAGLLVQPYLEVAGNISALGYTFTNQATLTGPAANPFRLVVNQDLSVNRFYMGDWSNAALISRTLFQTNVANSSTELTVVPSGTGTGSYMEFFNNSVPTNSGEMLIGLDTTTAYIMATRVGTGAYPPLSINVAGVEQMNFAAVGNSIRVAQPMVTTDITMQRVGTPNIAALWFGNTATHYFYWDGSAMSWNGSNFTVAGGLSVASGGFLSTVDGTGLQMLDANTRIFSAGRNTYFDEYNGGWRWRNTATGSNVLMFLDSSGNMTLATGLIVGPGTRASQVQVRGSGGATGWSGCTNTSTTTMSNPWGVLFVEDLTGAGACGGTVLWGCGGKWIGGIKAMYQDGTNYGAGYLSFATRSGVNDPALTERVTIAADGLVNIVSSRLAIGGDCLFTRGGANVLASPGLGIPAGYFLGIAGFAYGSGGYGLGMPNAAGVGQAVAFSWVAYACVDHAREFNLAVEPVKDPVSILKTLDPVRYEHTHIELGAKEPSRRKDGSIISAPAYGMSAKQVQTVLPELVGPAEGEPMTIDYSRLVIVLWAACQELESRLSKLEAA